MVAVLAAALSVISAAVIAVAAYADNWILLAAVALPVLALGAGWPTLLRLPHPRGSAVLVGATGLAALGVAVLVMDRPRPLSGFAGVLACAVLAAFGHEMLRQDGRKDVVESVTGTLSGQVLAVLASGWVLLPDTPAGVEGVLVTAAAVGAARLALALPWRLRITAWLGFAAGVAGALVASLLVEGVAPATAAVIGVAVAGAVATLDRLLAPELDRPHVGLLAAAAAPVAAAGTVAYAAIRLVAS